MAKSLTYRTCADCTTHSRRSSWRLLVAALTIALLAFGWSRSVPLPRPDGTRSVLARQRADQFVPTGPLPRDFKAPWTGRQLMMLNFSAPPETQPLIPADSIIFFSVSFHRNWALALPWASVDPVRNLDELTADHSAANLPMELSPGYVVRNQLPYIANQYPTAHGMTFSIAERWVPEIGWASVYYNLYTVSPTGRVTCRYWHDFRDFALIAPGLRIIPPPPGSDAPPDIAAFNPPFGLALLRWRDGAYRLAVPTASEIPTVAMFLLRGYSTWIGWIFCGLLWTAAFKRIRTRIVQTRHSFLWIFWTIVLLLTTGALCLLALIATNAPGWFGQTLINP